MLRVCVGKLCGFKRIDSVGTSIRCSSADDMVFNSTLGVLSDITCGGCNLRGEKCILLYLNVFKYFLYTVRALQGERDLTEMIYPTNILNFVYDNNRQIVTNFSSVLFNTKVKLLKHDGHLCTFRIVFLDSLLQHTGYFEIIAVEANMITIALL